MWLSETSRDAEGKEAHRSASRSQVESSEADGATVPEAEHSENAR